MGEFQERGFDVTFRLRAELSDGDVDQFWDAFILDVIEPNGLAYGGGMDGFVCSLARGSATETHRALVRNWLDSRPETVSVTVGPLVDAWRPRRRALNNGC